MKAITQVLDKIRINSSNRCSIKWWCSKTLRCSSSSIRWWCSNSSSSLCSSKWTPRFSSSLQCSSNLCSNSRCRLLWPKFPSLLRLLKQPLPTIHLQQILLEVEVALPSSPQLENSSLKQLQEKLIWETMKAVLITLISPKQSRAKKSWLQKS